MGAKVINLGKQSLIIPEHQVKNVKLLGFAEALLAQALIEAVERNMDVINAGLAAEKLHAEG